jgi:hypothetical protein
MKNMTPLQKTILLLMSLTALCLCAIAVAIAPPASNSSVPPIAPTLTIVPVGPTPFQHQGGRAIYQCRQFIRDRLVSPSSAKFSYEEAYKVNGEPLNYHAVTGIVESQNRMGVWLQSNYRCDAHYLPESPGVWVLDYLDIQD